MVNHGFVQVPCHQCRTTVWISPQVGMGVCPSCHAQNQMPQGAQQYGAPPAQPTMPQAGMPQGAQQYGAPPAQGGMPQGAQQYGAPQGQGGMPQGAQQYGAPPAQGGMPQGAQQYGAPQGQGGMPQGAQQYGAPQGQGGMPQGAQQYGMPQGGQPFGAPQGAGGMPGMPAAGGIPVLKIVGSVVLAIVVAGGYFVFNMVKSRFIAPKGKMTYSAAGLKSSGASDGDVMITGVAANAKKWKKDSIWWSANFLAVRPDGTVDVTKGAEVVYISPSKVSSIVKSTRQDSLRKFVFGASYVDFSRKWNALNQWKGVEAPAIPTCTIKQLTKALEKEGLTGKKTVRISFNPSFDWGAEQVWRVRGTDPKIDASYSMKTCAKLSGTDSDTGKGDATGGTDDGGEGE